MQASEDKRDLIPAHGARNNLAVLLGLGAYEVCQQQGSNFGALAVFLATLLWRGVGLSQRKNDKYQLYWHLVSPENKPLAAPTRWPAEPLVWLTSKNLMNY